MRVRPLLSSDDNGRPVVLVADDNPDILRLVERRLSKRGYAVVTAADGRQALQAILDRRPDAVILDWLMPGIQGKELCRHLKANPATRAVPVVLLTARAAETDVTAGFESGADDYVTKPFDVDELDDTLRRLLPAR